MTSQYRCETCKHLEDAGQGNRIFGLYYCSKCDIMLEPVFRDQICCTGCASHSDFQKLEPWCYPGCKLVSDAKQSEREKYEKILTGIEELFGDSEEDTFQCRDCNSIMRMHLIELRKQGEQ